MWTCSPCYLLPSVCLQHHFRILMFVLLGLGEKSRIFFFKWHVYFYLTLLRKYEPRCLWPTYGRAVGVFSPRIIFISQSGVTVTLLEPEERQELPEFKVKSHSFDVPSWKNHGCGQSALPSLHQTHCVWQIRLEKWWNRAVTVQLTAVYTPDWHPLLRSDYSRKHIWYPKLNSMNLLEWKVWDLVKLIMSTFKHF